MNRHFAEAGDPAIRIAQLANGFTVVTEAMPQVATATLGVWVGAGSRHERPHEHGLSHLIEHMAFKGTTRRTARQIAEDVENVGGDINAATSTEYTAYTARVLGENVDLAIDVLGVIRRKQERSERATRLHRLFEQKGIEHPLPCSRVHRTGMGAHSDRG